MSLHLTLGVLYYIFFPRYTRPETSRQIITPHGKKQPILEFPVRLMCISLDVGTLECQERTPSLQNV